jgi:ABC-2 type transport system permease protein
MTRARVHGSVVRQLIIKDWRLHRMPIILSVAGGAAALVVAQLGGPTAFLVGGAWFFIALIIFGSLLPPLNIVNERKKQNLAFLMSLPISSVQYASAKLLSTIGMFLAPWLMLVIAALLLIQQRGLLPHGTIPLTLILAALPLVGFCLIAGGAFIGEGWGIAATVVCNSSYWLVWYVLMQTRGVTDGLKSRVAVWNPTVLTILCGEFAFAALILGITFYIQSRKRDFV